MNEQRRYDIRDAARLLGVAPSTLRYWEDQGIIRAERDPASRYRKYGLSALVDASEIVLFRSMGVPVKDLADYQRCTVGELDALLAGSHFSTRQEPPRLPRLYIRQRSDIIKNV